jgi:hypothetical protein
MEVFIKNNIAQNLIPHPSFELVDSCSNTSEYISISGSLINYYCSDWFDDYSIVYSSSDLMGDCLHPDYNAPNTIYGYSSAFEGKRFAGLGLIGLDLAATATQNVREYMSVMLTEELIKDSAYCVSFYYKRYLYPCRFLPL